MTHPGTRAVFHFQNFILDLNRRTLTFAGEPVFLAPKEFLTLTTLVEASGQAVARETLIAAVWPDTIVTDNSLARNISTLRRHLGSDAIEVVPKFGYRFALPVSSAEEAISSAPAPVPTRLRLHLWATAAALILIAGFAAVRLIAPHKATAAVLTWTDPQTHLTWTASDNGADVTHDQAIAYCRQLTLAGHHDWRLPTIEEIQTLYDTSLSAPGIWGPTRHVYWHVKGNLHLTGGETASDLTWLTELTPAGEEQSYDFSYGRRNYDPTTFHADHRALCVR